MDSLFKWHFGFVVIQKCFYHSNVRWRFLSIIHFLMPILNFNVIIFIISELMHLIYLLQTTQSFPLRLTLNNSPVSCSLWQLNYRSEDASLTGLASIWSTIFTNSNGKKICLLLCLLCIFKFQTLTCRNLWIFYFMSRLTLYEFVNNVLYSAVTFNLELDYFRLEPLPSQPDCYILFVLVPNGAPVTWSQHCRNGRCCDC